MNKKKTATMILPVMIVLAALVLTVPSLGSTMLVNEERQSKWDNSYGGADKSYDTELLELRELMTPKFQTLKYHDEVTGRAMTYNLYIPEDYDESKHYPLVLFMADGSTTGKRAEAPLMQGYGGIIWATEESQSKNPAFVLTPVYAGPDNVVNDEWEVSEEVDMTVRLLQHVVAQYNIDENRLYTTGQSMGCMISFYLNSNYPDLFAASLFVGGQWDISVLTPLTNMKFFYVVSAGDPKASKGMKELRSLLENSGVEIGTAEFAANLPSEDQEKYVQDLISEGHDVNFIAFTKGTVAPATVTGAAQSIEHMYSFDCAYKLEGVRNWLFEQKKNPSAPADIRKARSAAAAL